MSDQFWLLEWLDDLHIKNVDDVTRAIAAPGITDDLYERAATASAVGATDTLPSGSIIAGRSLDLSGEMVGADGEQLIQEVGQLFGTVWHYFDNILVESFAPRRYLLMHRDGELELAKERILAHCEMLLYLRKIDGAVRPHV